MKFKILAIPPFHRQFKRLSKKYPSLEKDLKKLVEAIEDCPRQGASLGKHCYKVRLALSSKGRGQSGSARVIMYVHVPRQAVYLLAVYDKSDATTITDNELIKRLRYTPS